MDNVPITESEYEVRITAYSLGGSNLNYTTLSVHNAMTKVTGKLKKI